LAAVPAPLAVYTDVVGADVAPGVALLEEAGFAVRVLAAHDPAQIAREAAEAVALLIGGYTVVGAELLAALPRLRIVATMSVGFDMVDLAAARARAIWVANVPGAATEEVAVHAFAMGLSLLRGLPFLDRSVRAGHWDDAFEPLRRPSTTTLGVFGLGRIGRRVGLLGQGVYGRVVGHDPLVAPDGWPPGVEPVERDALLAAADVVTLHLPLTPETHHVVDAAALARMRPGAFLVNVSRGALVEPQALLAALDGGRLGGAALDVLEVEPAVDDDPLVGHPRTLVTPHAAWCSDDAARAYVVDQARNVVAWHREGRPHDVVVAGA
jgi:D-3-phosphoglycerate dehydrogenase